MDQTTSFSDPSADKYVYLVTIDEHADYGVVAVFATLELAVEYVHERWPDAVPDRGPISSRTVARWNNIDGYRTPAFIERWPLFTALPDRCTEYRSSCIPRHPDAKHTSRIIWQTDDRWPGNERPPVRYERASVLNGLPGRPGGPSVDVAGFDEDAVRSRFAELVAEVSATEPDTEDQP